MIPPLRRGADSRPASRSRRPPVPQARGLVDVAVDPRPVPVPARSRAGPFPCRSPAIGTRRAGPLVRRTAIVAGDRNALKRRKPRTGSPKHRAAWPWAGSKPAGSPAGRSGADTAVTEGPRHLWPETNHGKVKTSEPRPHSWRRGRRARPGNLRTAPEAASEERRGLPQPRHRGRLLPVCRRSRRRRRRRADRTAASSPCVGHGALAGGGPHAHRQWPRRPSARSSSRVPRAAAGRGGIGSGDASGGHGGESGGAVRPDGQRGAEAGGGVAWRRGADGGRCGRGRRGGVMREIGGRCGAFEECKALLESVETGLGVQQPANGQVSK